jgi:hypothetical protein
MDEAAYGGLFAGGATNKAAPMLVPVAALLSLMTERPVAVASMRANAVFLAKGPSIIVGPLAPMRPRHVAVIRAR